MQDFTIQTLGTLVVLFYAGLGVQVGRVWRAAGKCPVTAFRAGNLGESLRVMGALLWPLVVLGYAYSPEAFDGVPRLAFLQGWPASLAGLFLICLGGALYIVSAQTLGNAWRIGTDPGQKAALVTTGIYSRIRHPIYSGLWLMFLGVFLMVPNLVFGTLWAAASTAILQHALHEERFLASLFGREYRDYLSRTGRFFPILC